jgi:Ca2+-binding RTX toxin-like protein
MNSIPQFHCPLPAAPALPESVFRRFVTLLGGDGNGSFHFGTGNDNLCGSGGKDYAQGWHL